MDKNSFKKHADQQLESDLYKNILQYRQNTLEINRLLTQPELNRKELKKLKSLFLQDASDLQNERISTAEWQEIMEERIVVVPTRKELCLLAQALALV